MIKRTSLVLPLVAVALSGFLAACEKPVQTPKTSSEYSTPAATVSVPSSPDRPAASDRIGAPLVRSIEAGQSAGSAPKGGAPEPSGGATGPAPAPPKTEEPKK